MLIAQLLPVSPSSAFAAQHSLMREQPPRETSTTDSLAINENKIFLGCFDIFFLMLWWWVVFFLELGRKIIIAVVLINRFDL